MCSFERLVGGLMVYGFPDYTSLWGDSRDDWEALVDISERLNIPKLAAVVSIKVRANWWHTWISTDGVNFERVML